jgi:hypothetical protein
MHWDTRGRRPEDPYFRTERLLKHDNRPAEVEAMVQRVVEIKLKNSRSLVRADSVEGSSQRPGPARRTPGGQRR